MLMLLLKGVSGDIRVLREAQCLADDGFEVWVSHLGAAHSEVPAPNVRLVGLRLLMGQRPGAKAGKVRQVVKAVEYLAHVVRLAITLKPAVIHAHDLPCLVVGVLVRALSRTPCLIYDAHELWPDMEGRSALEARMGRCFERWAIRRTTAVIAVNGLAAEVLKARYGPFRTLLLGNRAQPYDGPTDLSLRKAAQAAPEERVVLSLGRFSAGRGIRVLIEAVSLTDCPLRLVFLGDGPLVPAIEDWAREFRVSSRVTVLPPVSQDILPAYIRGADLGVVLYEATCLNHRLAQPNKLFQFLEAGVPVVASNLPGVREVVQPLDTGELVDPGDPEAVARGLKRLAAPERRERCARNAREARASVLWSADAPRLLELYRDLVTPGEVRGVESGVRDRSLPT